MTTKREQDQGLTRIEKLGGDKRLPEIGQLGRGQAEDKTPRATKIERAPAGSFQASYISSKLELLFSLVLRPSNLSDMDQAGARSVTLR